ncbi:MAG TPA: preQ(1) synthase [Methanofastidiosum sp.]|nr:preQ(1) synthase [Methanofastidiosum sp.]
MRRSKRYDLRLLGQGKKTQYRFTEPMYEIIETFENPAPERNYTIKAVTDEVTALCPVTSQPDYYTVVIKYVPDERCVESKSLKLYLFAYRQYGTFIETMANKILSDLVKACEPRWMRVSLTMKPRGGILLTTTVVHAKKGYETVGKQIYQYKVKV